MKKFFLFTAALIAVVISANSQRVCGTMEHFEEMKANDPAYELRQQDIEQFTQEFVTHAGPGDRVLVTIPVVVHVVWNTTAENISDAQILSQIDVLNKDFRKLNSDVSLTPSVFQPLAADVNIQFCLASVDPNGSPTTGITRTQTSVTSFSTNGDPVKFNSSGGRNAWPASSYLNVWVCDLSSSLLGYAQFPGGSASTDGVVCDYLYFGTTGTATAPFNKGRTATHEVGHWLNLRHIWGDANCGNDLVSDTPTQQTSNYGCPAFPKVTCSNGPNGDLFMNYMDYTDDACMYMFTNGQAARMQALFSSGGARASLLSSNGCGVAGTTCLSPGGLSSSGLTASAASLSWGAVSGAQSYNLRYKATSTATWIAVNGLTATSYSLGGLSACTSYEWQVQTVCSSSSSSAFTSSATFSTTGCVATYCASAGQSTADEWINRVVLNTINNTSGNNNGYGNFTGISTTLATNTAYTFSGTPGFAGAAYSEFWRVWIDYNGDLDFLDAGELVLSSSTGSSSTVSGTFTVPSSAVPGSRRMRVSMKYGSVATSCETFPYGEVEDYTVNIIAGTSSACNSNYEDNDNINQTTAISLNTFIYSFICPAGDEDWFRFSNSSSQRNLRVTLESLPADYNMFLYNPSGVLVASAQNSGTANEVIIYNNGPVGTYRLRIIGNNGATNGSDSYALRATRSSTAFRFGDEADAVPADVEISSAFPNPTDGLVDVQFNLPSDEVVSYRVLDLMGREVVSGRFAAVEGSNQLSIDLSREAVGTYIFSLFAGEKTSTQKLMKQ